MIGDVLSIAGALIIFFSWLVTNIRLEEFKSAKAALTASQTRHQLVSLLNEVLSAQDSLASAIHRLGGEIVQSGGVEAAPTNTGSRLLMEQRERFAAARLRTRQITHGRQWALTDMGHFFDSAPDALKAQLVESADGLNHLADEIKDQFEQADMVLEGKEVLEPKDIEALDAIYAHCSDMLLPRFGPLMEKMVEASNKGREALREAEQKTQRRWKRTRAVALVLYVLGSILTLSGAIAKNLIHL